MDSKIDHSYIDEHIAASIETKKSILSDNALKSEVHKVAQACVDAYKKGNKVILAGNGGSAADAQHIAAEFVSRFKFDRPGLPSISLATDTSMITAIGNDYGYENVFKRQLEANGKKGDIFFAITTSGNSENIITAIEAAKKMGIKTVGFLGKTGGKINGSTDYTLNVPCTETALIQESHIMLGHMICDFVERSIFKK